MRCCGRRLFSLRRALSLLALHSNPPRRTSTAFTFRGFPRPRRQSCSILSWRAVFMGCMRRISPLALALPLPLTAATLRLPRRLATLCSSGSRLAWCATARRTLPLLVCSLSLAPQQVVPPKFTLTTLTSLRSHSPVTRRRAWAMLCTWATQSSPLASPPPSAKPRTP